MRKKLIMDPNSKINRLIEYSRTAENTSNRRLQITSNILKLMSIFSSIPIVILVLGSQIDLNKIYIHIVFFFLTIINFILSFSIFINYWNSSKLNEAKYKIIIDQEKKLFGHSLYAQEYEYYKKQNNFRLSKKFSSIEKLMLFVSILLILFNVIFWILISAL